MLTGAGIGRRRGGAAGPRGAEAAAPLSFNARRRRLRFAGASVARVRRRARGPIKGWSGSWACVPGLARKSRR
jgi:hypothetical protein